jgi:4,5-DOPA dioxygenase extradiol
MRCSKGDFDALVGYVNKGPNAKIAHQTAEHFVPLLLAAGAGTEPGRGVASAIDRIWLGNSIRSIQID